MTGERELTGIQVTVRSVQGETVTRPVPTADASEAARSLAEEDAGIALHLMTTLDDAPAVRELIDLPDGYERRETPSTFLVVHRRDPHDVFAPYQPTGAEPGWPAEVGLGRLLTHAEARHYDNLGFWEGVLIKALGDEPQYTVFELPKHLLKAYSRLTVEERLQLFSYDRLCELGRVVGRFDLLGHHVGWDHLDRHWAAGHDVDKAAHRAMVVNCSLETLRRQGGMADVDRCATGPAPLRQPQETRSGCESLLERQGAASLMSSEQQIRTVEQPDF